MPAAWTNSSPPAPYAQIRACTISKSALFLEVPVEPTKSSSLTILSLQVRIC